MQNYPVTSEAFDLMHRGAVALAQVESNGMRVDMDYIDRQLRECSARVAAMEEELLHPTDVWKVWRRKYGDRANLESDDQLVDVLFNEMGFKSIKETAGGRAGADKEALLAVDHPFCRDFLKTKQLKKAINTNLRGIKREAVQNGLWWFVHVFFNLHTTDTYRSSSDNFNFQNLPIRDPELGKLIRTAFLPRPGRHIVEIDFSGAEVRVAACYHKDPAMISYIMDETKDMHRDSARELFLIPGVDPNDVPKAFRQVAKGAFVFAEFYGDWYISVARNLWKSVNDPSLKFPDGRTLKDHMASMGIRELGRLDSRERPERGTFEHVVKEAERALWETRFPVYNQWRKDWYAAYQKQGWFETLTGFVCSGHMTRNQAINYPVQGSSFHCLLWSLIKLVLEELQRRNMKSIIVGQIHDSIVADVLPEELHEFLRICRKVMVKLLARHYPWLIVPMAVEVDVAPVDRPWSEKAEWDIEKGDWKKKK